MNRSLNTALTAVALTLMLVLMLVACRPTDEQPNIIGNGTVQPLNSKQSGEVRSFFIGLGRVHSAAFAAAGLSGDVSVNDAIVLEMKTKIQKPDCTTSYRNEPSLVGNQQVELKVEGTACPLTVFKSMSSTVGNPGQISVRSNFSINDTSLRSKNDVVSLTLNGNGKSQIIEEGNGKRVQLQISGNAQSLSKGTVRIVVDYVSNARMSGENVTVQSQQLVILDFPSSPNQPPYSARLLGNVANSSGVSQSRYWLNGIEIPEIEFNEYMRHLGLDLE